MPCKRPQVDVYKEGRYHRGVLHSLAECLLKGMRRTCEKLSKNYENVFKIMLLKWAGVIVR